MNDLQVLAEHFESACCPEDVFGIGEDVGSIFKRLARACHPDVHKDNSALAEKAFRQLQTLKLEADARIKNGQWGKRLPLPHCIPLEIGKYSVIRQPKAGDVTDLYLAKDKSVLVKVARNHDDNDLLRAEATALTLLKGITTSVKDGVPQIVNVIEVNGTWKRQANVITNFPDFVTAQEVKAKMDIDARTSVWMFKRILTLLTWLQHFKLVHGGILPPHVLLYPDNDELSATKLPGNDPRKHSIRLIGWCCSVDFTKRTRLSSWVPMWKSHYPLELLAKECLSPASDIYMAAYLIRYLMGGNTLPPALEKVLQRCLDPDVSERFQKAEDVFEPWVKAATKEFGAPKWHDFNVP